MTFFDRMDFFDGSREHNCRPLREGNENTAGVPPLLQRGCFSLVLHIHLFRRFAKGIC
jgi:hypothetical protein